MPRGYIHNVDYYFEADDEAHRQNADLLMLTQGWRRYDWRLMSEKYTFRKAQPIEDQFYLYGKLNVYRKRNPVSNVHMYVSLYNEKGQSLIGNALTDSVGNYAFKLPFVDGEWKMNIYTTNAFVKKLGEELGEEDEFIPITEKDHVLQNVTVKAKRRYFTNDDWRFKNEAYGRQYATLYYDIDKELDDILDRGEPVPLLFDFLARKNSLFGYYYKGSDDLSYAMLNRYDGRSIDWIIDNNDRPLLNIRPIWQYYMDEVKSMYIVPDDPRATDNRVAIYIYLHTFFSSESNKGLRRTYFQGFNQVLWRTSAAPSGGSPTSPPMHRAKPRWSSSTTPRVRRCISAWKG